MLYRKFLLPAVLITLSLLAITTSGRANGLINNLPDDGSFVIFKAKSELDLQGNLQTFERELKIASVGKQEVEGKPARWIELATEFAGQKVMAKLLIEEKYLKGDQDPFEHIVKAWGLEGGQVVELPENRLRRFMIFALGVPHFDKPEKKEKEKIKTDLGEFECQHLKGETEADGPMDQKIKFNGELWTNDKVPFGLVKAKIKSDIGVGSIETEMEAIKSGKDAKSELPDAK